MAGIKRVIRGASTPIPGGYIVGNPAGGNGPHQLISLSDLGRALAATGTLASGGQANAVPSPVTYSHGGTGVTAAPGDGELLIGTGSAYTLATLTAGHGITIANAPGAITIAAKGGNGMLPLVTGDILAFSDTGSVTRHLPAIMYAPDGQCIGVPL